LPDDCPAQSSGIVTTPIDRARTDEHPRPAVSDQTVQYFVGSIY
jgi:hypothetical protein